MSKNPSIGTNMTTSTLRSIVYVSTAVGPWSSDALEALVVEARDTNAKAGVSGVLLFGGGNFIQCLEGPSQAVDMTYARILASRRHANVIELLDEPIETRSFSEWHMGFRATNGSAMLSLASAKWSSVAEAGSAPNDGASLSLLREFWRHLR